MFVESICFMKTFIIPGILTKIDQVSEGAQSKDTGTTFLTGFVLNNNAY